MLDCSGAMFSCSHLMFSCNSVMLSLPPKIHLRAIPTAFTRAFLK
jgi:hypothetical protein